MPKLGQWQSMGAIPDKRENKEEKESDRWSIRLGEQNQAAYYILALTLS